MVFTIGEILLDIIFLDGQPVGARPGGSMLNTSVSLGRCGLPVRLISETAKDMAGEQIIGFLAENGVDVRDIYRYEDGKTAIALAFLDKETNAHYSFYKIYPQKRLPQTVPDFHRDDILLFGSFYSLSKSVRDKILANVEKARDSGSFIIYDPNIRSPHKHEMNEKREMVLENIRLSNLVRGSDEDFHTIFDVKSPEEAWNICQSVSCKMLIYTMNRNGVMVFGEGLKKYYPVPDINPVSTIGAGDSFNAGIIYELYRGMGVKDIDSLVKRGIEFAEEVCLSVDNYVSGRRED